jgi:nitrogen fixation NifU-like protein
MSLDALYQEIILDHFRSPRNFGKLDGPATGVHHENPSCGDQLDLQVRLDDQQRIGRIKFYGRGCAISQSSASMMTELVKGKTVAEAHEAIASFKHMLTGEGEAKIDLGDLVALSGVRQFPVRVKCATLA